MYSVGCRVHAESPASASEAWQLAKYYQASALIPKDLKNIADVFVTIAAGRDFGWSPMQSMRGIYVVKGKPSLSADAMVGPGLPKQAGDIYRHLIVLGPQPGGRPDHEGAHIDQPVDHARQSRELG